MNLHNYFLDLETGLTRIETRENVIIVDNKIVRTETKEFDLLHGLHTLVKELGKVEVHHGQVKAQTLGNDVTIIDRMKQRAVEEWKSRREVHREKIKKLNSFIVENQ